MAPSLEFYIPVNECKFMLPVAMENMEKSFGFLGHRKLFVVIVEAFGSLGGGGSCEPAVNSVNFMTITFCHFAVFPP